VVDDHAGKGYATEMVRGVLTYVFTELKLPYVVAAHYEDNHPSATIFRKLPWQLLRITLYKQRRCPYYKMQQEDFLAHIAQQPISV
jgi:RimJ/RimL family protein N-acetyltransferase